MPSLPPPNPPPIVVVHDELLLPMDFPQRLASLRKDRGLTQQALADLIEASVIQIHRYESGSSQPTLPVIRKLSVALGVSADELIFGKDQRGPDEDLRLQFEAISRFSPREKDVARAVLDGLILKHEARRWVAEPGAVTPNAKRRANGTARRRRRSTA